MENNKKYALVTGGSAGIGKEIALELARSGINVAINYRKRQEEASKIVEEMKSLGVEAIAIQADVSKYEEVENLLKKVNEVFPVLNIVINNAGITSDALILRMKEEQFDSVIDVNLKGVWNVCKVASKYLLKSPNARIVNISSVAGIRGNIGQTNYSAAKAGVIGLSKSLAKELASRNVTVNVVAPGFIDTEMTEKLSDAIIDEAVKHIPLSRIGVVSDVAKAVKFLVSDDASYITGQVIAIDGGLSI
ncbi:3-oxoacyl-[acyl-carrier-protein] reductase [Haploplasma axanthum]|uniref:3-oxoacyl-[acyl-carrier-protein] reductase n=1 Tax=Haploplasma axanthum TaxID=29552 RepID=A0A449BEW8_HAPAX|nr:3-oxoacyl-[acyl-carrier-protein] reductase [Haploplasma axanthum]VEU80978.1 short chain dehydrogenase family protein [Haploplasma axanthum]